MRTDMTSDERAGEVMLLSLTRSEMNDVRSALLAMAEAKMWQATHTFVRAKRTKLGEESDRALALADLFQEAPELAVVSGDGEPPAPLPPGPLGLRLIVDNR